MVTKISIMRDGSYVLIREGLPMIYLSTSWRLQAFIEAAKYGISPNIVVCNY